jgi:hypothetical protein
VSCEVVVAPLWKLDVVEEAHGSHARQRFADDVIKQRRHYPVPRATLVESRWLKYVPFPSNPSCASTRHIATYRIIRAECPF